MSRIILGATVIYWEGAGVYRPLANFWIFVGDANMRVCDINPDCIYLSDPFGLA